MQPEIIHNDHGKRPIDPKLVGQSLVGDRHDVELAAARERLRLTEHELSAIRERAIAQDKLAAMGQLAACAAHEINQPLSYLKVFCESIIRDGEAERLNSPGLCNEAREACRQIERIRKINRQTLRYSRPEFKSLVPQEVPPTFERALVLMNPQLKRFGVKLSEKRDAELPFIMGDSGKLEQLFVNLLQNAIDALANQSKKMIQVCFSQHEGNVVISFSDNGPGVPVTIRKKIFEPFFSTKASNQGTGLGLSIAADIVRSHQGEIVLNTKKKNGTEFIVRLPVLRDQQ